MLLSCYITQFQWELFPSVVTLEDLFYVLTMKIQGLVDGIILIIFLISLLWLSNLYDPP